METRHVARFASSSSFCGEGMMFVGYPEEAVMLPCIATDLPSARGGPAYLTILVAHLVARDDAFWLDAVSPRQEMVFILC
jgi:uncharacterized protein (DUF983 family)